MTNPWLQFLAGCGAHIDADSQQITGFDRPVSQDMLESGFIAPLTDLGLIAASGEDAAPFLHSQLTNDVEHLDSLQARLAGYCSPKGRLLATFSIWKQGDSIILQLPRQIQPQVQKRLQMFVLRAKVKLNDVSAEHVMLGIGGQTAGSILAKWFPSLPDAPYAKTGNDAGTLIRVADAFGSPRYQWITSCGMAEQAWPHLIEALAPVGTSLWRLADIYAGIPQITQETHEQFVPQMVNFELIGGVNFKKGCYPGQEIVARSQYLGKLKRRMMLATVAAVPAKAGTEIFSSADPEQPCGMLVNAEPALSGGSLCLVEVKLAAIDTGTIHLGSVDGPRLEFDALPYPLPTE